MNLIYQLVVDSQFVWDVGCGPTRAVGFYFASDLKQCLERNAWRQGRARVPEVALFATVKQLQRPGRAEGFDSLYHVTLDAEGGFRVEEWKEESDGTG